VDSVTFCLSKGLSAPVGAMICGDEAFVAEVHRARKVLGGGMRQAGIIAAAGIVALETMPQRLQDDHKRARRLAEGFAALPGVSVGPVHTNIFYFSLTEDSPLDGAQLATALKANGIILPNRGPRTFRAVTHIWVTDEDVTAVLTAMGEILG
jgi:threonine aldolase